MRRRRNKGLGIIALIMMICLFLIAAMRTPSLIRGMQGTKEQTENVNGDSRGNGPNNSNTPAILENDISVADSFGVLEEQRDEEMEELTFLMGELSFERSGSQMMMFTVAVLLISYLVLIGPVTYFYLKKKRKMEWMWLILPLVSLAFGCIILLMSNDFTITEPYVDVIKLIRPGEEILCYGASTSPGEEDYSLYFDRSVASMHPWMIDDHYKVDDERRCLTLYPDYAFERDYFQFEMNQIEKSGFMHNLQIEEKVGVGVVYNTTGYDFSHILLCYEDNYCVLPLLKDGDRISVEAEYWKKDEHGMIGGLKEELQMQTGLSADEEKIFSFAWYEHWKENPEELHIAGVFRGGSVGMIESGVNLISYSLFYQ